MAPVIELAFQPSAISLKQHTVAAILMTDQGLNTHVYTRLRQNGGRSGLALIMDHQKFPISVEGIIHRDAFWVLETSNYEQ